MKARFIEDEGDQLGITIEPETQDEMLLLKVFTGQSQAIDYRIEITEWRYNEHGRPQYDNKSTLTSIRMRIKRSVANETPPETSHPIARAMINEVDRRWVQQSESKRALEAWERDHGPFPFDRVPVGATITTLRSLAPGDCFKFLKTPAGWSDGKLVLVDQAPGWAMPEGWDFVLKTRADEALADQPVILLDEKAPIATGPVIPEE
jgi:hypothetical protein